MSASGNFVWEIAASSSGLVIFNVSRGSTSVLPWPRRAAEVDPKKPPTNTYLETSFPRQPKST